MISIDEVDEYFGFGGADINSRVQLVPNMNYPPWPQDINMGLILAESNDDELSFNCLQHYTTGMTSTQSQSQLCTSTSQQPQASDNHDEISVWANGGESFQPAAKTCCSCRLRRNECMVIFKNGVPVGPCLSCAALSVSCSFDPAQAERTKGLLRAASSGTPRTHEASIDVHGEDSDMDWHEDGLKSMNNLPGQSPNAAVETSSPRVGTRFPRESVKVLRQWLSLHQRHPYPSDEEKSSLRQQTGLTKLQITNWLANARRRGKNRQSTSQSNSTSPKLKNASHPIMIPKKNNSLLDSPMERWTKTPPGSEGTSMAAIVKAIKASSNSTGMNSPFSDVHTDNSSGRSPHRPSSVSSVGTKSSVGSRGSAVSRQSHGSFGSFGKKARRRRRRHTAGPYVANTTGAPRQFQCTFCTETFKTKHDWQRHENTLHLSLERWVCAPKGPTMRSPDSNDVSCVFCGARNPTPAHMETHNYSGCLERSLEERTFYRKDHLRQHLRLVHDTTKLSNWSMESWKVTTPDVRSRCGFCGIEMSTWRMRVEHIAGHFKSGKSMADWRGDWGFDASVNDMVENGMSPSMIHHVRTHSVGKQATDEQNMDRSVQQYDLFKTKLTKFLNTTIASGHSPTDRELRIEANRLTSGTAYGAVTSIEQGFTSWFSDLFQVDGEEQASRSQHDLHNNQRIPRSNEMLNFCQFENELLKIVGKQHEIRHHTSDDEIRDEACAILVKKESSSTVPSQLVTAWIRYKARTTSLWIARFRQRAGLRLTSGIATEGYLSDNNKSYSSSPNGLGSNFNHYAAAATAIQSDSRNPPFNGLDFPSQASDWILYNSHDSGNWVMPTTTTATTTFSGVDGLSSTIVNDQQ